jgi:uncharacterized protein with PQ loop repeat
MTEAILIAGSILLAVCALPQLVACIRQRHAAGVSWLFLLAWGLGEILLLAWACATSNVVLALNYGVNAVIVLAIAGIKIDSEITWSMAESAAQAAIDAHQKNSLH